jgi:hypothetical protein
MPVKSSILRAAARSVLAERGFEVRVKPGQGYLPGSRLEAKKDGKETVVAVKASQERTVSFTRQSDDLWRTLRAVDQVLAVVPAAADAEDAEVMAFERDTLVAAFDRAWKSLEREKRPLSFKIPVFIPLDKVARKNVGHDVGNLKALAIWSVRLTKEQIRAMSSAEAEEDYVDAFIRRYAKDHRVEEHQVLIGITGRRK